MNYGRKAPLKIWAFRRFAKVAGEGAEHSARGRLFQRTGAHDLKDRDPVLAFTLGTDNKSLFDMRTARVALTSIS